MGKAGRKAERMKAHQENSRSQRSFLLPTLAEQCDPRHPLQKLADRMPWKDLEEAFAETYSKAGRPAKSVRLMTGLLLLKQMYNESDESVVERWKENPYWQQFCGMEQFQWELPCDPSDLVYFRQRIGERGMAVILAVSAQIHGKKIEEAEVVIDSTAQEKNITYPIDTKQYRKIIARCWKLADRQGIRLRRRYRKEVRVCLFAQRWRKDPRKRKAARRGQRRLRTIAGGVGAGTGTQTRTHGSRGAAGQLQALPARVGAETAGSAKDLLLARAACLLHEQRQGTQEIRIWNQSEHRHHQRKWDHRGGGSP